MATIKEVAKKAGVSIATVSYCFTGARNVKPETKLRVMQVVEELHYVPNATARTLRTARADRIGIVLPDISDPYYAELLKGISEIAAPSRYILNIELSFQNPRRECEMIEQLVNENISGLLIMTCQPHNTGFFANLLERYQIPTVFLHNQPAGLESNYVGFSNRKTMRYLTSQLLSHGYTDIDLICGDILYSSEEEALQGIRDAFLDQGLVFSSEHIHVTNMTKENAFKATMESCTDHVPHALITTSSQMALGIKEALDIQNIRVPEDILVAALGNASWNLSSHLPGVIYTKRAASQMSRAAMNLLSDCISSQTPMRKQARYLDDDILSDKIRLDERSEPKTVFFADAQREVLTVLATDTPSMRALDMLSGCYSRQSGVEIRVDYSEIASSLACIEEDAGKEQTYDLYLYDTPWTEYLAEKGILEDLTPFIRDTDFKAERFYDKFWENAGSGDHLYGIPVIGATQILFYRKDLFEQPAVMKQYKEMFGSTLKPPLTWQRYNQTAAFFTRTVNPKSPTLYGTAIAGDADEYLAPELMIRIWSRGGKVWDRNRRPTMTSRQMGSAYRLMAETFQYAAGDPFSLNAEQVTSLFCEGDVAMIIAFTEYAGEIRSALNHNIISNIGYVPIPERTPMQAGWNLGISKKSPRKELAYDYFKWLTRTDIAYYYTILGGQAGIKQPYDNSEIIELYPWMELTKSDMDHYYRRSSPQHLRKEHVIPVREIEKILCRSLRRTVRDRLPVQEALIEGQGLMEELFKTHGY